MCDAVEISLSDSVHRFDDACANRTKQVEDTYVAADSIIGASTQIYGIQAHAVIWPMVYDMSTVVF